MSEKLIKFNLNKKVDKSYFHWYDSHVVSNIRLKIVLYSFLLAFLVIAVRLIVIASSDYNNKSHYAKNYKNRLNIVDRNNNLLAVNIPAASLYANPLRVVDVDNSIKKLLTVIPNLDKKELYKKLTSKKSFVWIKRDITPIEHEKIYNLGMPGFSFEKEQKRIYTYGNLLSHVVGYVGRDLGGLAGVEKHFDEFLTEDHQAGGNKYSDKVLKLSIDSRIQNILSEEIDKTMKKFSAKGAAGIVVDPNNGEILAMVSKPDFNPHYPGKAKPEQLFNMATQGVYEVGSSLKSITMSVGLDSGKVSMHDAYNLSYMKVGNFQVKDYHPLKGWHSVPYIFLKSSNVGVSQIVLEVGKDRLRKYLKKLRLFERLNLEIAENSRPLYLPFSKWNDLSLVTMSYGYSISESPAHFAQAMVPVVNGGILYPLTLIKRKASDKLESERVFKKETSENMRKLMRLVVEKGTGRKAEVKGYYIGGKTGTAEIAQNGKYNKNKRMSSFFAIMPATKPKYMIYIIFNEPKGIKETYGYATGGWTAAPTVGAVFNRIIGLYGISKLDENSPEVRSLVDFEYKIKNET